MDNISQPLLAAENSKPKKYGAAALGITGMTIAAALLLAGRSKVEVKPPTELIEEPWDFMNIFDDADLVNESDTCMKSFDRAMS